MRFLKFLLLYRRVRLALTLCLHVGTFLLLSAPSFAQESASIESVYVDFTYRADPECVDAEEAFALVHRRSNRVRRSYGDETAQHLIMKVERTRGGYTGTLIVLRPGHGEERRSMKGDKCTEVVEALALTAALSIDPNATLTLGPAAPSGEEPASQESSSLQASPSPDVTPMQPDATPVQPDAIATRRPMDSSNLGARRVREPTHLTMGLTVGVEKLMERTTHLAGGLFVALSRHSSAVLFPVEMRLSLNYSTEPNVSSPSIFTRFFYARFSYCPVRWGSELALLLCPTAELGAIWAQSRGFADPTDSLRLFASVGAEAWLRARIARRFDLWLSPALVVPLTDRRYGVEPGPEEITSSVSVGWAVSSGIGWVF